MMWLEYFTRLLSPRPVGVASSYAFNLPVDHEWPEGDDRRHRRQAHEPGGQASLAPGDERDRRVADEEQAVDEADPEDHRLADLGHAGQVLERHGDEEQDERRGTFNRPHRATRPTGVLNTKRPHI